MTTTDIKVDESVLESLDFVPKCQVQWKKLLTGEISEPCGNRADYDAVWEAHGLNHKVVQKFACEECVFRTRYFFTPMQARCSICAEKSDPFLSLTPLR